jgi:hypothetical protein
LDSLESFLLQCGKMRQNSDAWQRPVRRPISALVQGRKSSLIAQASAGD